MGQTILKKMSFFLGYDMYVSRKRDIHTAFKFYAKEGVLLYIEWCKGMQVFWNGASSLGSLQSVAICRLCVGLTDVYNIGIVHSWYQSIYTSCFLFIVKFEDGMSNSVLRNKATLFEKIGVQKRCVFKTSTKSSQNLNSDFEVSCAVQQVYKGQGHCQYVNSRMDTHFLVYNEFALRTSSPYQLSEPRGPGS